MFHKLKFFRKVRKESIEINDFDNPEEIETINLNQVTSISEIRYFYSAYNPNFIGKYVTVTMSSNERYYIDVDSLDELSESISKAHLLI